MKGPDLDVFVSNARKTLVEAQVLCQEASMRILGAKGSWSRWQQDISKMKFMINSLKSQGDLLYNSILKVGIGENLIKTEWSQGLLKDLIESMNSWQKELSSRIDHLDHVDNQLVSTNPEKEHVKLGDFIPKENAHILNERLKEIPIIRHQIDNIKSQYTNMMKKVQEQVIQTKLKTLETSFEENYGDSSTNNIELGEKYLSEMTELEHELVEYLNSLTDHFDKCKLIQSDELQGESRQELLDIVTRDNSELGSVLVTLRDTIADVDKLLSKFRSTLDENMVNESQLQNGIRKIVSEFQKYQEYLIIFKDISELISTFKETCTQEVQVTKDLCDFYEKFESSYYRLIDEADRRRSVAAEMAAVIADCEGRLQKLSIEDQKAREKFLSMNGDYLPETIWPGMIDDFTPLYSLQYTIKDI